MVSKFRYSKIDICNSIKKSIISSIVKLRLQSELKLSGKQESFFIDSAINTIVKEVIKSFHRSNEVQSKSLESTDSISAYLEVAVMSAQIAHFISKVTSLFSQRNHFKSAFIKSTSGIFTCH